MINEDLANYSSSLIQSWNDTKEIVNGYVTKAVNAYVNYNKFNNNLSIKLKKENQAKNDGNPIPKKELYLNSLECFNQSVIVKKSLDDFLSATTEKSKINDVISKGKTIYEKLSSIYNEVTDFVRQFYGPRVIMILKGKKANGMNTLDYELIKKFDLDSIYNCLIEYEAVLLSNDNSEIKKKKKSTRFTTIKNSINTRRKEKKC